MVSKNSKISLYFECSALKMSSHYYVGEDGSAPSPPPPLPPRNSMSSDPHYDTSRRQEKKGSPNCPSMSHSRTIKPMIPTLLKSPSHESALKQPSPHYIRGMGLPPPIPPIPNKPTKRPPPQVPSPQRVQSFNIPRSVPSKPRVATPKLNRRDNEVSSDSDSYEDVSFSAGSYRWRPQSESTDGDGIQFFQFIEQRRGQFPLAFEVIMGFSSVSEDNSISEGEKFIAHFLKRAKMFTIEDENKEQYAIPYNTSFHFAPLHNPNDNKKEAMSGFIFKTAGDIMISRTLPKVVRAKKYFRGISPESCVSENELLFVKEVVQNEGGKRYLKCVQVSSGKEKQLHEECNGDFSTAPHEVRVYLPELLKHFQLPMMALMCMGPDNEEDLPSQLVSTIVTISTARVEESLVASYINDDGRERDFNVPENVESAVLNDIPLNFDINVNPLPLSPNKAEKILRLTDMLYKSFTPSSVHPYIANYSRSQLSLIKSIRKEDSLSSIVLVETNTIKERRLAKEAKDAQPPSQMSSDVLTRVQELESQNFLLKQTLEKITGRPLTSSLSTVSLQKLQSDHSKMRKEIDKLKETVEKLSNNGELIISIY